LEIFRFTVRQLQGALQGEILRQRNQSCVPVRWNEIIMLDVTLRCASAVPRELRTISIKTTVKKVPRAGHDCGKSMTAKASRTEPMPSSPRVS